MICPDMSIVERTAGNGNHQKYMHIIKFYSLKILHFSLKLAESRPTYRLVYSGPPNIVPAKDDARKLQRSIPLLIRFPSRSVSTIFENNGECPNKRKNLRIIKEFVEQLV
jgi:hypothetical protein